MRRMAEMRGAKVPVGIPRSNDAKGRDDGADIGNAALMAMHEYGGTIHIPECIGSVTRRIRADGTFAYNGRFRKK